MLTYLINVVDKLIMISLFSGLAYAYMKTSFDTKWGKRAGLIGIGAGFLSGLIYALIDGNVRIVGAYRYILASYYVYLIALIVAFVLNVLIRIKAFKKKIPIKAYEVLNYVALGFLALTIAAGLYIILPDVYQYPFGINEAILSSDFLLPFGGYLLGLIVCILSYFAMLKFGTIIFERQKNKHSLGVLLIGVGALFSLYIFALWAASMTARRFIDNTDLFLFAIKIRNAKNILSYIELGIGLFVGLYSIYLLMTSKDVYKSNAEKRKIRAGKLHAKRWLGLAMAATVVSILCYTLFPTLNTVQIDEVITENPIDNGDYLYIPFGTEEEGIADGHLHRFVFTSYKYDDEEKNIHIKGGVDIYFIVIKKPNSSAYGVGLDACEICGTAGYYELDGDVVCARCSVHININTIGFKGGCNPIVFPYTVSNGNIIIEKAVLNQFEYEFD